MPAFCRDCFRPATGAETRCRACGSPRILRHAELDRLAIAHIDCDAFYAAVEKRDDPSLRDKPVIVGGGRRGVVSTCCYVARLYGVRSAMPMFEAMRRCPQATVLPPDMAKYAAVSREVRAHMLAVTPLVEPLSLDEAFLDLSGTEKLHGAPPALTLARLGRRIEDEVGITVSIGLSYNKFLAKLTSDLDKPRGFAVVGRAEALDFLGPRAVGDIWGVGKVLRAKLEADGIRTFAELRTRDEIALIKRYGAIGRRLYHFARGEDDRTVEPDSETKSISAETTFETDIALRSKLEAILWRLCEKVSARLKRHRLAGRTVTLKLKSAGFRLRTRAASLSDPTQLAETIYRTALPLLEKECDGTAFRLIGIGVSALAPADDADPPDLLDAKAATVERTIDRVRERFGTQAIGKGRGRANKP